MPKFRKQAERLKLARLLQTDADSLAYLDKLDLATVQTLRFSCRRYLLEEHRPLFKRVATAVRILPSAVVSKLAQRVLGPLLCARVAGELDTPRLIHLARHLPPDFMAQVSVYVETDQTREVASALPLPAVVEISHHLVASHEFSLLGDLMGHLPMPMIEAVLRSIHDGEALLRIAFFVENTPRLSELLDLLPPDQVMSVIRAAANEATDLWPEALALISVVKPHWQRRLVSMALDGDEDMLVSMVRGVVKHGLWSTALPLLELMTENHRRRLINLPIISQDEVLRQLLVAAHQNRQLHYLLPMIELMEPCLRQRVIRLSEELGPDALEQMTAAFNQYRLWQSALLIISGMGAERRRQMAELMARQDEELLIAMATAVYQQQLWPQFFPLMAALPSADLQRLINLPLFQEDRVLHDIVAAAHEHGLWDMLLPIADAFPERDRRRLAMASENMTYAQVQRLVGCLHEARHWTQAFHLLGYMRPERRTAITLQVSDQPDGVLNHMLRSLNSSTEWPLLLDLIGSLSEDAQHQLVERAGSLDTRARASLMTYAEQHDLGDSILRRMADMTPEEIQQLRPVLALLPEDTRARLRQRCEELGIRSLLD